MLTDYGKQLNFILQELRQGTPATVVKIEALRDVYGPAVVFYGAYVLLSLQLHVDRYGVEALAFLTRQEVTGDIPAERLTMETREIIEALVQCFCAELHVDGLGVLVK
jgi:hypothetical protein